VSSDTDGAMAGGTVEINGKMDPKNPDIISGSQTLGGSITITWKLKMVRPRAR